MDEQWRDTLWHFWWLIFPIIWFVFGVLRMSLRHNARQQVLDVLQTYAQQGKDPPPELLAFLREGGQRRGYRSRRSRGARAVSLGMLALAFAVLAALGYGPHETFIIAAVILSALAIAMFLTSRMTLPEAREMLDEQRPHDHRPDGP